MCINLGIEPHTYYLYWHHSIFFPKNEIKWYFLEECDWLLITMKQRFYVSWIVVRKYIRPIPNCGEKETNRHVKTDMKNIKQSGKKISFHAFLPFLGVPRWLCRLVGEGEAGRPACLKPYYRGEGTCNDPGANVAVIDDHIRKTGIASLLTMLICSNIEPSVQ